MWVRFVIRTLLALLAGGGMAEAEEAREVAPPVIFIALDAVPYRVVAELKEDRAFSGFAAPVPLISTFPSTSNLAFSGIFEPLGVDPAPGYEVRFFDRDRNRRRGAGLRSYFRLRFPWRDFFDWRTKSLYRKSLRGLYPVKSNLRAIERSLEAFLASDDPAFFIHYGGTDLLGHMRGPAATAAVLRALDRDLQDLRDAHPDRPFFVVLFSDHGQAGGAVLRNVGTSLRRHLAAAGYRVAGRLRGPRDVVFMPFGLISSLVLYTVPERAVAVADTLAAADGIDLCVAREDGGWRVTSGRGDARIRRRDERGEIRWSYRPLRGDPLGLAPILAATPADGDGERWLSDRRWLTLTDRGDYPDPLYRIARGFDLVTNPASVICSTAKGYMYGAVTTELLARVSMGRLRWTHGALRREASYGFLMSDFPGWREERPVRFSDALVPFETLIGGPPAPAAGAGPGPD